MSKNKLIFKNTIFLASRTIFSLCVSFYTTRIVLHQLGVSDYGLFSVVYGVVAFFVFVVSAMNDSVQRFISVALGRNDLKRVKDIVKNSIFIYICAGLTFSLILLVLRPFVVNNILNIGIEATKSANQLYYVALASIVISIMQTPFNAIVLANEKMSFYAYMAIFDACSKLAVSYLIVIIPFNKVVVYSLLLFLSTLFVFLIYIFYCFIFFKSSLHGGRLDRLVVKEITFFSFWNVFGNFAYVCRTQGINIVINVFFATAANAAYALSNTILNAINSLTQAFITAVRPQIFKSYAELDSNRYNQLICGGSKFAFSLLFLLSCPVLLCTNELLSLWLVNIPPYTVIFVRLIIIVTLIDSFSSSIITGIQATGKIKRYQLIVGFFVFSSLPLTYLLYSLGAPVYSTFVPMIVLSIFNLILRLFFISNLSRFDLKKYIREVLLPCTLFALISFAISFSINSNILVTNVLSVLMLCFLYSFISFIVFFIVAINRKEKEIAFEYLKRRFK